VLAAHFDGQVAARAAVGVSSLPGGSPVEVVLSAEWADG
jgi:enamine deaminase RidA (YjgF/YER057c/UK114 family)